MMARARILLGALLGLFLGLGVLAPAQAGAGAGSPRGDQIVVLLRLPSPHFRAESAYGGAYGDGAGLAARRRIARRLAHDYGLIQLVSWPIPAAGVDCFIMRVSRDRSVEDVAAAVSRDPDVAGSEPLHTYRAQAAGVASRDPPNDPMFRLQPAAQAWRLADLHAVATGRNVKVAVVDSRIDTTHPDLAGQIQVSRDFTLGQPAGPEHHGTEVAGIIAAVADNHLGIAGVAPNARLMALRACWQDPASPETLCDTLSLARALSFALENGAQVINLSLSGPSDLLLGRLIDAALARGVVVVGAVDPGQPHGGFPASHPGVVAVASDLAGAGGSGVVVAPGHDIPTTVPGGRWSLVSGNSYAAAHVSGLFALLRETSHGSKAPLVLVTARAGGGIDAYASLQRAGPCRGCAAAQPAAYSTMARP
jgi:subtilisin family serine protease